jgi:cytochrome P450
MAALASERAERWRGAERIDIAAEMNRLTLAIVARTLFGADVGDRSDEVREALTTVIEMFDLQASPLAEWLDRLPLPRVRRFRRAQARLDAVIYRLIAERRRMPAADRGDLLSLLLAARDQEGDGQGMTDQQLRDEAITVFLAGHETTANALAWTWWLLACHPEVERRWHLELNSVLEGRVPAAGDVAGLTYTRMVLAESMRLYPPAWIVGRRAVEDVEIGGYVIPRGTIVLVSQWVTHRDARFFPEPDVFAPERWEPGHVPARPRYAYFPFGGGSRVCIGEGFAWMEGILALATIGQRWTLGRLETGPAPMLAKITLRPKGPLWMRPEPR